MKGLISPVAAYVPFAMRCASGKTTRLGKILSRLTLNSFDLVLLFLPSSSTSASASTSTAILWL